MNKASTLVLQGFNAGIHTNYDDELISPSILRYAFNMYVDDAHSKIGWLTSRPGLATMFGKIDVDIAAVDPDDEICGMYSYLRGRIIVGVDTNGGDSYTYVYNANTGDWVDVGAAPLAWTLGRPIRFATIAGYVFAASGDTVGGTAFKSWDAVFANNWGTTNLTSAPSASILEVFSGRLYTIVEGTQRVDFSNQVDITTPGTLTWDTTYNYFLVPAESGNGLVGMKTNGNLLLIFLRNGIFTWDGVSTQQEPLYKVGALNQEVIQTVGSSTLFLGEGTGYLSVYRYDGSYPTDISSPVREFLKPSNLVNSTGAVAEFGSWHDGANYYLSISDVTLEGKSFQNVVLCYNLDGNSWTVMCIGKKDGTYNNFFKYATMYYDLETTSSAIFDDVASFYQKHYVVIGGTSLGTKSTTNTSIAPLVWTPSSNTADDVGETEKNPIQIWIQTHGLTWGSESRKKQVNKFNVFADGNYGVIDVQLQIDGKGWKSLGKLKGKKTTFNPGLKGYVFELRLVGLNTGEPFILKRIEFFDVDIESYEL